MVGLQSPGGEAHDDGGFWGGTGGDRWVVTRASPDIIKAEGFVERDGTGVVLSDFEKYRTLAGAALVTDKV